MVIESNIYSTGINCESHYIDVLGSKMHYLKAGGDGQAILFLHGMPASSYIWRHILPDLADLGTCYAPDLIGMGQSDKPDIEYTVQDHISYIEALIDALDLHDIVLVVHGWGSVIGLDIASRHPDRFKGVAMCESHLRPVMRWDDLSLPVQEVLTTINQGEKLDQLILQDNFLIEQWLPNCIMRRLTAEEMSLYRAPYATPESRRVLLQYCRELPRGEGSDAVTKLISHYARWLSNSQVPKLLLYAMPGLITTIDAVAWANEYFPELTCVELPEALHFVQETVPERFSSALHSWVSSLPA